MNILIISNNIDKSVSQIVSSVGEEVLAFKHYGMNTAQIRLKDNTDYLIMSDSIDRRSLTGCRLDYIFIDIDCKIPIKLERELIVSLRDENSKIIYIDMSKTPIPKNLKIKRLHTVDLINTKDLIYESWFMIGNIETKIKFAKKIFYKMFQANTSIQRPTLTKIITNGETRVIKIMDSSIPEIKIKCLFNKVN